MRTGMLCLLVLVSASAVADEPNRTRTPIPFTVSKETTLITEPLLPDGSPDYARILSRLGSEGVTPENNAAAVIMPLLLTADDYSLEKFPTFWEELGVEPPTEDAPRLLHLSDYLEAEMPEDASFDEEDEILTKQEELKADMMSRPWKTADAPKLAAWLRANEAVLDKAVQASERKRWFIPSHYGETILDWHPSPGLMTCRGLAKALVLRANLALGEGRPIAAMGDLATVERLGHLISQDPLMIAQLTGMSLNRGVNEPLTLWIVHGGADADFCRAMLERFPDVDGTTGLRESFLNGDQLFSLWVTAGFARHPEAIQEYAKILAYTCPDDLPKGTAATWMKWWTRDGKEIEADVILRSARRACIEAAGYAKLRRFSEFRPVSKEGAKDLDAHKAEALPGPNGEYGPALLAAATKEGITPITRFAVVVQSWQFMADWTTNVFALARRSDFQRDFMRTAAALRVYAFENGKYPDSLKDLTPKLLAEIPQDFYSDGALGYKRLDDGRCQISTIGPPEGEDENSLYADPEERVITLPAPKAK